MAALAMWEALEYCVSPNIVPVISQPLDTRAGNSDRTFQTVVRVDRVLAVDRRVQVREPVSDSRDCAVLGNQFLVACVVQQEGTGTVGTFGVSFLEGQLANERGRLVTQATCDRDVRKQSHDNLLRVLGQHLPLIPNVFQVWQLKSSEIVTAGNDFWKIDFGGVDSPKFKQRLVVVFCL
ncbi:hypothetical protein OGATHE_001924 [Ogataea polymorpha]|uniref:Uncharacterized protein n=1 Tax=Ogataea polymorpha TaxID=460523 RepID=A0A9P8PM47_9ASCO|nr:hypothetical protein OGATHE_001924 [Ogataea polymorpha]